MSQAAASTTAPKKLTVRTCAPAKARAQPLVMATACDAPFARLADEGGVDAGRQFGDEVPARTYPGDEHAF